AGKKVDEEPGKVRWWKGIRGRPSTASADNMLCHILFYSLRKAKLGTMTKPTNDIGSDNIARELNKNTKLKIGNKFMKILHDNAFNEIEGAMLSTTFQNGEAKEWWNNEIDGTVTTRKELAEKFSLKYYPLAYTYNSNIPDNLDDVTDYLKLLNWLGSKFKKHWNMDKNTKNGQWDFYVKECNDKGSIDDSEPSDNEYDEPYNKTRKNLVLTRSLSPI
nr:hypothetical protein [Tanacetum cinerariifolium]